MNTRPTIKKRELEERVKLEERIERLEDEISHGGSDPIRDGILTRLEKLEGSVGEELPRLFTRIEELERVRIELEAGMAILSEGEPNEDKSSITPNIPTCQSEGDKARQPGFTPHEVAICDTCQTPVLPGEWCACGVQYDPKARQPEHTGAIVCPKCGAYGDALRTKRCQPDEPMADMPETGPSDYKHSPGPLERVAAERDQARAERDEYKLAAEAEAQLADEFKAERDDLVMKGSMAEAQLADARVERDRLREGIEKEAREYEGWPEGYKTPCENVASHLRALLDGDDE